jgi:hypothetical protein
MARVQAAVNGGTIGAQVWMSYNSEDETFLAQPSPTQPLEDSNDSG